jgi:hypothetical protein
VEEEPRAAVALVVALLGLEGREVLATHHQLAHLKVIMAEAEEILNLLLLAEVVLVLLVEMLEVLMAQVETEHPLVFLVLR